MLMVRNSVRLSALVAALALAGCGTAAGNGDCDPDVNQRGCVAIMNFRSTTQLFAGISVPPRHPGSSGGIAPGLGGIKVNDTSVGSKHDFEGPIQGQTVKVTCTVDGFGWTEMNPRVILQQEGVVPSANCDNATW